MVKQNNIHTCRSVFTITHLLHIDICLFKDIPTGRNTHSQYFNIRRAIVNGCPDPGAPTSHRIHRSRLNWRPAGFALVDGGSLACEWVPVAASS